MLATTALIDEIAALQPDRFLDHFLSGGATPPKLPEPTSATLENARNVLRNRFDFVGEAYDLPEGFSWTVNPSRDKEWQIAQHKFYFAVDLIHAYRHTGDPAYLGKWVTLLESWLEKMASGYITASDAQVEARRIEHWVYALLLLRGTPCRAIVTPRFLRRFLERIAEETEYITRHLKPARNHRTFQLWAVFLVGVVFPEFRLHRAFLEMGRDMLTENLLSDFLPDGVHVELSTHYHQLALETALSFVELAQRNGIVLDGALLPRLAAALRFSMHMQWPDGTIPLIGDSDNGDHLALLRRGSRLLADDQLLWAATLGRAGAPPRDRSRHFAHSGYFILSDGWGDGPDSYARRQHVFYDCAMLGEGSHSHYDLFNFCYFRDGEAVVVDPGRYTYSAAPDACGIDWRRQFKSTAYHNTVTIDRRDQTRYISKFNRRRGTGAPKHGPAVEIVDKDSWLGERTDWVSATARSAEYSPLHQRLFLFLHRQYLLILDRILADDGEPHESVLRFHLGDRCRGRVSLEMADGEVIARSPRAEIRSHRAAGMTARLEEGWVSTAYGVKTPAPVVALTQAGVGPRVFCSAVAPRGGDATGAMIRSLRLVTDPADRALRFRVDGTVGGQGFTDWLLFPRGERPDTLHGEDDISFRGRFLAYRRCAQGRIVHLVAQRAERLTVAGGPQITSLGGETIEWSSPART